MSRGASRALDVLLERLLRLVRSTFALVAATVPAGLAMVRLTSRGGVTMLVAGGFFRETYRGANVPPRILSRSLEDSVIITELLMPWTVSAVFIATAPGLPKGAVCAVSGVTLVRVAITRALLSRRMTAASPLPRQPEAAARQ